ncbi:acetyl transferase protein [Tanticharoenia sakaeratensis NBRC 103193]|uniref:Acetyl transferase protein n=1 Tax=Tanticharoenia sakaeratensis NBRC 103193 TaxID=1231623 RepID=A0A0D6MK73_9PROT|nr:acetyl transferase protein [Tanticharoenia sakaeratensis NBRC 103193]GBQ17202.1 acetyltransferase [Tanticharoenia sakaeratensis NBRC 103193]
MRGRIAEPATRIAVDVTFLRMRHPPRTAPRPLPPGYTVERIAHPSVSFYRQLYDGVGAPYCWWLRRVLSDAALSDVLNAARTSVHVLWHSAAAAGFYELDRLPGREINLAYFGLLPAEIGQGVGRAFLDHAIATAWAEEPRMLRVNTCTADHPRALPTYLRAGFEQISRVREIWDIPDALGFEIPARLRVK